MESISDFDWHAEKEDDFRKKRVPNSGKSLCGKLRPLTKTGVLIITPVSRGRPDIKLAYKKMIIISEFCSDIIQLNLIIEQQICQCLT